ncbi:hypothetical protein KFL_010990020 [Klebsormidium nitens]|uniref:Uncharacterized protein n=1 Tax=Klebsormidium nitens TaxID=105231 RepID=A0A1Y1IPW4_KLENI|nr:hypothetical protein KFL_010990020 [Klebsormidium nitens]|eukprot:GAQ92703.1 hypothetical protein KFL_010990020 [Klebsormidium nitens]
MEPNQTDYNLVETCSDPVAYPEFYLQQLNALTSRGLPIDILAFQGQFLGVEPLQLRARLDKIASAGIPIWMSEVNVNILDVNKRADYLEFIFRECLVNLDFTLNAAGQRALKNEFTTPPRTGTTDSSGRLPTFNAFFGNFEAKITVGGVTTTTSFTVPETPGVMRNVVLSLNGSSATPTPTPTATSAGPTPTPTATSASPTSTPTATSSPTNAPSGTPAPSPAGGTCVGVAGFPNQCYAPGGDTFVCCDGSGCGPFSGSRATCASNRYAGAPVSNPTAAPTNPSPTTASPTANPTPGPVNPTPGPVNPTAGPVNPTPGPVNPTPGPVNPTPAPANPTSAPVNQTPAPVNPTSAPGAVPNPSPARGGLCDFQGQFPNQCYGPDGSGFICCDNRGCGPFANGHATCASGSYQGL